MDKLPDIKWPTASKVRLILIEGLVYKVYKGRKLEIKFQAEETMDAYWVEVLRTRPEDLIPIEPKRSA